MSARQGAVRKLTAVVIVVLGLAGPAGGAAVASTQRGASTPDVAPRSRACTIETPCVR
jgi:hypothetical protein